jgi:signal transduction histidine kinase/ActR/RegA family two-component response regulator
VLAWVAGLGLWLHDLLRHKAGTMGGRPDNLSWLARSGMPAVVLATLAAGYYLVNESSTRARSAVEAGLIHRVGTAALAIDPETLVRVSSAGTVAEDDPAVARMRQRLMALRSVAGDLLRVYLWKIESGQVVVPRAWLVGGTTGAGDPALFRVGAKGLPSAGQAHLIGPLGRGTMVLLASAPVVDFADGRQVAWLGFDVSADQWFSAQAFARVQTIALVGLFASVAVFFFAYQMLREYEAELRVAKESAEAADRAKEEFLAVMSHEIRTPMQSVLGYGELLGRSSLTKSQRDYLDAIRGQGRTLLRIVQDILDFAILRKSSYTLKRETVYLPRLVHSVFDTIQPLAARKALRTAVAVGDDVPEVVGGDGVRIEQILLNLLGNAVKFTDHGEVRLDVTVESRAMVDGQAVTWVLFRVADTGVGIRHGETERLFEPFVRLTQAEGKTREGAGLGLATVKRLCELMGGRVEIESTWGRGTTFFVRLPFTPIAGGETPAVEEAAATPAATRGEIRRLGDVLPLRVLVADDNPFVRKLMGEYFCAIGYEPVLVENGAEACARWREFDLVVMDLRMPGMDGVAAARRIREESRDEAKPWIVGVSATLAETEIERAMAAGMNDFLGKPFFVQSLVEAIEASPLAGRLAGEASLGACDASAAAPGRIDTSVFTTPAHGSGEDEAGAACGGAGGVMSWMPDLSAPGDSEIVEQAIAEMPGIMDEIGAALGKGDHDTAAERAHYLKNTILALRIEPMIGSCREVFELATLGDTGAAERSLQALRAAFTDWRGKRAPHRENTERSGVPPA